MQKIQRFLRNLQLGPRHVGPDWIDRPITCYGTREALRAAPNGSSARPTGVPYEAWKCLNDLAGLIPPPTKTTNTKNSGVKPYPLSDPTPDPPWAPGPWHPPKSAQAPSGAE